MKKASVLTGILCAAALFLAAGIQTNAEEKSDEYKFKVISEQDKTCSLSSGAAYHDTYTIPDKSPDGYKVVSIGKGALSGLQFKEVIIPEGVETICEGAFYSCDKLEKVQWPKTLKNIETKAFYDCYYLQEVTLYDGFETIGQEAFGDCVGLEKVTLPKTTKSIGKYQFSYDGQTIHIYYDGTIEDYYKLFEGQYTYDHFVRVHCSKIATPTPTNTPTNTPTPKPTATLEPTETPVPTQTPITPTPKPTTQVLPGPIGIGIMQNPDFITSNGNTYKINKKEAILIGTTNKGSLIIPDSITTPFNSYKVTGIADGALKENKTIKSVNIGLNVRSIGKDAFNGCKKLKKITIRSTKLKPKKIGKNAFNGIYKKATFKVPKKYKKDYKKVIKKMLKGAKIS